MSLDAAAKRAGDLRAAISAFRSGDWRAVIVLCQGLAADSSPTDSSLQLCAGAHFRLGNWQDAERNFRLLLEIRPDFPEAWFNLAKALAEQGRWPEALASDERGLGLKPDDPDGWDHLGVCLRKCGRWGQAAEAHRQCLSLAPGHAAAINNLGIAEALAGQFTAAASAFAEAGRRAPDNPEIFANLGHILRDLGRTDEAERAYLHALRIRPDNLLAWSGRLMNMLYAPESDQSMRYRLHQECASHLRVAGRTRGHRSDKAAEHPVRIGYVSSDTCQHSVAHFLLPILRNHDRKRFSVTVFSNCDRTDEMTVQLRQAADQWQTLVGFGADQAAETVEGCEIDILVDLNGHTGRCNLPLFARRPAPVQISYLGYPDTTGLSEIDYRLSDSIADADELGDKFFSEKLWRLRSPMWCYSPPREAPEPNERPVSAEPVFGSCNNPAKVNTRVLRLWSQILGAVPESTLVLKGKTYGDLKVRQEVYALFRALGVAPDRIKLCGWETERKQHFAFYSGVDIALDTFPYAGTTTTCEAFWMGVPVVTLAGAEHRSRVGKSLLSSVQMDEGIATSEAAYVKIAVQWANDFGKRRRWRAELRQKMARSPLMDGRRLASDLEDAYLQMLQNVRREAGAGMAPKDPQCAK